MGADRIRYDADMVAPTKVICLGLLVALLPSLAVAEESSDDGLQVEVTAGAWLARMRARTMLGGAQIDLESDVDLRDTEPSLNVEIEVVRDDRLRLMFSGFHFETESTAPTRSAVTFGNAVLAAGELAQASAEMTSFGFELAVEQARPVDEGPNRFQFSPLFGLRWVAVDQRIASLAGGGADEVTGEWTSFYVGGQFRLGLDLDDRLPIGKSVDIRAATGIGPVFDSGGGFMAFVRAEIRLEVIDNVDVFFGYRLLELEGQRGDFDFEGGLQGLFVGGAIRF